MRILLLLVVNLFLVGCERPAADRSESPARLEPHALFGTWNLMTIAGDNPSKLEIQSWQIEFLDNGAMKYSGTMTGSFAGMQLEGSGTWKIESNQLQYTIGSKTNTSNAVAGNGMLLLSPDPVIRRGGVSEVETIYAKKQKGAGSAAPSTNH